MKRTMIVRSALLLLIIGLLVAGKHFQTTWTREKEICDKAAQQLQQVTEEVDRLKQELGSLNLSNAQAQTHQAQLLTEEAHKLSEELETLQTEIDALTRFLEENKDVLANAEDEMTYLQGVYDALEDGLQKVEEYLPAD